MGTAPPGDQQTPRVVAGHTRRRAQAGTASVASEPSVFLVGVSRDEWRHHLNETPTLTCPLNSAAGCAHVDAPCNSTISTVRVSWLSERHARQPLEE